MPKRSRAPALRPEVQLAVNDILHGTSVDSHTEWLQREYIRMMRREARLVREQIESKSTDSAQIVGPDASDGNAEPHRSTEQHRAEDNGASPGGDTTDNN